MKLPQTTDAKIQALAEGLVDTLDEGAESVRSFFQRADVKALSNRQKVFVYSHAPPEKLVPYAQADICLWWPILTAQVVSGDLDQMKRVYKIYQKEGGDKQPDMDSALTWVTEPMELVPGVHIVQDEKIVKQLFAWGAKADYEDNKWYKEALSTSKAKIILAFLEAGASTDIALNMLKKFADEKPEQAAQIWSAIGGMAPSYLADRHILSEQEYRLEPAGLGTLKKEFDFHSRRVREIYVAPKKEYSCMDSISFDDYDSGIIDNAREKLVEMGGNPGEKDIFGGKKRAGLTGLSGGAGGPHG